MKLANIPFTSLSLACSLAAAVAQSNSLHLAIAPGPFVGTMDSLTNYHCPEWFRDAKFGMWAHWGPQAVPMDGDWYARHMYEQGHRQYTNHLENFGHASTNGYKDIIPLWKAEKWDPDRLMALYKKAGAKYFVSMGSHHDNFFLWDSKLHRWNAVNMGPKRDVVATWQAAAKKQGLRFGVSEHLGASFTWFQSSHRSDKTGPLAGVPYDGANPAYEDLYHFPAEPGDTSWYSKNPRWQQQWFNEIKELVDNYHLDLLYTDGGVPFGNEVGLSLIADLYNTNLKDHGGNEEVVYNCKQKSEGRWVEDLERGVMPGINPHPWQTDTSIGDWYYNKNWKFRPVSWTIHMLVDIVSKNGNLLLNIVQRPDGSLDPEVEQALEEMASWIALHGEAIYGTRPWQVYGEGAVRARGGSFKEDFAYSSKDIRFTAKGDTLYAFAMGWPDDGELTIRSLARPAGEDINRINDIRLLGYDGRLSWSQTTNALVVKVPAQKVSPYTAVLRITGTRLKAVPVPLAAVIITPDSKGVLNLRADDAELHGAGIKTETKGVQTNIGFWDNPADYATWTVQFPKAGSYQVSLAYAAAAGDSELVMDVAGAKLAGKPEATGGWDSFKTISLGRVEVPQAGQLSVAVRPRDARTWKAINLRTLTFRPAE